MSLSYGPTDTRLRGGKILTSTLFGFGVDQKSTAALSGYGRKGSNNDSGRKIL